MFNSGHSVQYAAAPLIAGIALLLSGGCRKDPALWEIKNLNGNEVNIFGHGGMGEKSLYQMDTQPSLKRALDMGADGTEMDMQITRDSVLVLYHDENLSSLTKCEGAIPEKNWDEMSGCDYRKGSGNPKLITASAFFDATETNNRIFTFDCKYIKEDRASLETFSNALLRHIQKYSLISNCFIETPFPLLAHILHSKDARLKLYFYTDSCSIAIRKSKELGLYGLVIDRKKITSKEIEEAHRNNLRVTLFNMGTEEENLQAIQMSPDNVQTDKLDHLLKIFEKYREP